MAEESKNDKYIRCSKCGSKYINDEEHISTDFGYTRLDERYKKCVKCRARGKISRKKYYDSHREELKEYSKKYREEHQEEKRTYDILRCLEKVVCPNCNCEVGKQEFARHQRTQKCKSYVKPIENETTPSETSTVDTENMYEPLIMADDDASNSSNKPVVKVDDEIANDVVNLLTNYSTNKLDKLIIDNNTEHVFAYAEIALNRKYTTFRNLSWCDMFPLIAKINNATDYAPSDDEIGFRNM